MKSAPTSTAALYRLPLKVLGWDEEALNLAVGERVQLRATSVVVLGSAVVAGAIAAAGPYTLTVRAFMGVWVFVAVTLLHRWAIYLSYRLDGFLLGLLAVTSLGIVILWTFWLRSEAVGVWEARWSSRTDSGPQGLTARELALSASLYLFLLSPLTMHFVGLRDSLYRQIVRSAMTRAQVDSGSSR